MRTEHEMMKMIIDFATKDDRIRLATLEGSRTNKNIPPDAFQDYDLSYFVTDMDSFKENDHWLDQFGKRIMMQKPEDMELFPSELGNWFSYLILFEDGNKLDLTLILINEVNDYFADSDGLVEVLLDKDSRIEAEVIASDRQYWIKKPTAREFDDCCNEFWYVSTYSGSSYPRMWQSLFTCYALFRKYSKAVANGLGYEYPDYDQAISTYTESIHKQWA
ncbi:aminoglycoside 6-adenylyltransferase [Brevibacillus reuszeri]|uniref:aminoglycoside 6-adenylyltransferase n=1 Tax=Brevibacillus reuszeri TaxID=54915 RepID=UPI003D1AF6EE